MELLSLKGKVALVTGSTRGIGLSCAELLAQHGANVVLNGLEQFSSVTEGHAKRLSDLYGVNCISIPADVSNDLQVANLYKEVFKAYKRLDILVNNAGILHDSLIGMTTAESVNKVIDVNVKGVLFNIINASRLMSRNKSGSIINLSSIVGRFGNEGQLAYSSSKAAVIGATYAAAKELGASGIRVNAVAPGVISTDMIKGVPEVKMVDLKAKIRMGRIGTPEDIAKVVLFLASDLSAYVTGQVIGIDGGMSI